MIPNLEGNMLLITNGYMCKWFGIYRHSKLYCSWRQHVSGPTHCHKHTLDLILSHGIDIDAIEILQQSGDI